VDPKARGKFADYRTKITCFQAGCGSQRAGIDKGGDVIYVKSFEVMINVLSVHRVADPDHRVTRLLNHFNVTSEMGLDLCGGVMIEGART
jgi:hypothetical protein